MVSDGLHSGFVQMSPQRADDAGQGRGAVGKCETRTREPHSIQATANKSTKRMIDNDSFKSNSNHQELLLTSPNSFAHLNEFVAHNRQVLGDAKLDHHYDYFSNNSSVLFPSLVVLLSCPSTISHLPHSLCTFMEWTLQVAITAVMYFLTS